MRILLAAIICCTHWTLGGCDSAAPAMSDDEVDLLRDTFPTMLEECVAKARIEGIEAINIRTDLCFPMQPPRRWVGVWVNEFEGSRFCPKPAEFCLRPPHGEGLWLSFTDGARPKDVDQDGDGAAYEIEFVGRRTEEPAKFGRDGAYAHEVVVDRIVSIRSQED